MTIPTIVSTDDAGALEAAVVRPGVFKRLIRSPLGVVAMVILLFVVVIGIIGPYITPFDPNVTHLADALQGPGPKHLLGTDDAGRDILSRLLAGTRITLLSAVLAAAVAVVVGLITGLIAGYFGGWFDSVMSRISDVLLSLPAIIVLLAVRAALGSSIWVSMGVFGILMIPGFFRLTRASVNSVKNELYVDAARVAGLGPGRIIGRHILFVVRAPVIIQVAMVCGLSIEIQAILDFLGLGDPIVPSWGAMLDEGFVNIYTQPLIAVWSGLVISLTVGAFMVFGNALRDALEDTQHTAKRKRVRKASYRADTQAIRIPSSHLLSVSDLSIAYADGNGVLKTVVSDIEFHVDRGEVLGLVGESGSGKTQTAFSILGLLPTQAEITSGNIEFDGTSLVSTASGRISQGKLTALRGARIAYVPQEPMSNLDPNYTIGYQLVRPLVKVLHLSRKEAKTRAFELLGLVGIDNPERVYDAYPHEISGGMAQRVLIAGAVSCEPDLLIADEPTTALDVTIQAEVLDLLRDLQLRFKMGVILVTHNFGVVADLCDRVAVMQKGRIVEAGEVRQILHAPADPYTVSLLSSTLEGKTPRTKLMAENKPLGVGNGDVVKNITKKTQALR